MRACSSIDYCWASINERWQADDDAHIPLILMGPGIRAGEYTQHAALNDLAPTLATLLKVTIPGGSSGRVLTEAIQTEAVPRRTN